jgi:hypothetical protein
MDFEWRLLQISEEPEDESKFVFPYTDEELARMTPEEREFAESIRTAVSFRQVLKELGFWGPQQPLPWSNNPTSLT